MFSMYRISSLFLTQSTAEAYGKVVSFAGVAELDKLQFLTRFPVNPSNSWWATDRLKGQHYHAAYGEGKSPGAFWCWPWTLKMQLLNKPSQVSFHIYHTQCPKVLYKPATSTAPHPTQALKENKEKLKNGRNAERGRTVFCNKHNSTSCSNYKSKGRWSHATHFIIHYTWGCG